MEKVATYCQAKLAEQNYHMQLGTVYWYPDKQQACFKHCKQQVTDAGTLGQPEFLTDAYMKQDYHLIREE